MAGKLTKEITMLEKIAALLNVEASEAAVRAALAENGLGPATCGKCNGSGKYYGMYGTGACYPCEGRGIFAPRINRNLHAKVRAIVDPAYAAKREAAAQRREAKRAAERAEACARWAEKEAERKAEEAAREAKREAAHQARVEQSLHVGTVGERLTLTVTCVFSKVFDGYYGESTLYKMVDDQGNEFATFTNGSFHLERGESATIKATVKEHDEYNGVAQTKLTRCKVQ